MIKNIKLSGRVYMGQTNSAIIQKFAADMLLGMIEKVF